MSRVILLVLDSLGIGAAADADRFGDVGSDTLGHIADYFFKQGNPLHIPNLCQLGLDQAYRISTGKSLAGIEAPPQPMGSYACAAEISSGKDTPSGHWEMMGVPALWDWGYFPYPTDSFPAPILDEILANNDIPGYLGNCHASGTEIISRLGEKHMQSGKPIFYTSADSVFQIACHEQSFGLERLYQLCQSCREILMPLNIGRVIARPFIGTCAADFERTGNRHDYAIKPPSPTLLQKLVDSGGHVTAIGKIGDIFAHTGISREVRASGHEELWNKTLKAIQQPSERSIIMTNFVDFDALYGHRRDPFGYGQALEEFDRQLPKLLANLDDDDLLIITADHGNDPTWKGTDHTREHVPILLYQKGQTTGNNLGHRSTFADIAQTIALQFDLPVFEQGTPMTHQRINKSTTP